MQFWNHEDSYYQVHVGRKSSETQQETLDDCGSIQTSFSLSLSADFDVDMKRFV